MVWLCPRFKIGSSGSINLSQLPIDDPTKPSIHSGQRPTIKFIDETTYTPSVIVQNDQVLKNVTNDPIRVSPINAIKRPTSGSTDEPPPVEKKINLKGVSELIGGETSKDKTKKQGVGRVSGIDSSQAIKDINYDKFQKDKKTYELIKKALMQNEFIKNLLNEERLNLVVDAMRPESYEANSYIIKEGETGSHLYVSDEGSFEVVKGGKVVKKFGSCEAFGELAILYKAKRFASIRANTNAKIWVLDRRVFQKIMVRSGKQEQEDNIRFLSSVPDLEGIHMTDLVKMSGFLKREFFATGAVIVKQGEKGDKFYIIRGGTVFITKRPAGGGPDQLVKELSRGDYFGEQALLHDDKRLATVIAKAPGVECLTIERGPFNEFFGNIEELKLKSYPLTKPSPTNIKKIEEPREFDHIKLNDLEILGTLGVGAFGRVELVQYGKDKNLTFALKCLKKVDVVLQQQQEHVFNEKSIMYQCNSPFICKLYKTYKDTKYLYFLMEPILGGDVWTILQKKRFFDEKTARFMTACVVEAFEHLHSHNIVYRDLKPENLMLDYKGYVKLVDFGYAKYVANDMKTYTFAGTPEYVAPEVILGNGHDKAVDYWALGVFIHELLSGKPPFRATNHVKTYNLIIRGIDTIDFNPKITKTAQLLIRKLCRSMPTERLGYLKHGVKDIKNHKWFLGFEWEKLREGKMQAPLVRPISSSKDMANFDRFEKEKTPPDENSGFDRDF